MRKKIILTVTPILFFLMVRGQDYVRTAPQNETITDKKFSFSLSIGPAMPLRDFGSTNVQGSFWDFNSLDSVRLQGFAKTGFHFDVTASYLVSDNIGVQLMLGDNINAFDINAFYKTMGYAASTSTPNYKYHTSEYMIGPLFSMSAGNKLKINASILVGLVKNDYPEITLALNDTLNYTRSIDNGKNALGFCINAGITYALNDNFDLLLNVSYTGATISYPSWTETYQFLSPNPAYYYLPITFQHPTDETKMVAGILKPTIGIAIKL